MLKLSHITKSYQIKTKKTILALNDVNIEFKSTGFVTILGPSGAGKSTILNILGGIDNATEGQMIVDGKVITLPKDLEMYRNAYTSFVFQDFNLITDLSVYENLALVCPNRDKNEVRVKIEKTLSEVGLVDYSNRMINELSGGEIQRVTIARALIKESKIILADEPTGNLNIETGKLISELLKNISKEKLVIVVTHNEFLANAYSDRIIHIEDGKVISDTNPHLNKDSNQIFDTKNKTYLSFSTIFKMAFHNLVNKKLRLTIMLLLNILAFLIMGLTYVFVDYDRSYVDAKNIENANEMYMSYRITNNPYQKRENSFLTTSEIEDIVNHQQFKYIVNNYVNNYTDLILMGFELYDGYTDLTSDGVYISDMYLENLLDENYVVNNPIDQAALSNNIPFEQLNGAYVYASDVKSYFKISGIYKVKTDVPNYNTQSEETYNHSDFMHEMVYARYFYREYGEVDKHLNLVNPTLNLHQEFYIKFENNSHNINFNSQLVYSNTLNHSNYSYFGGVIIDDTNVLYDSEVNYDNDFSNNEAFGIYVTLDLYNMIFNQTNKTEHYISNAYYDGNAGQMKRDVLNFPSHINETISISVKNQIYPEKYIVIEDLVIKGIILSAYVDPLDMNQLPKYGFLLETDFQAQLYNFTRNNTLLVATDSLDDVYLFIKYMNQNHNLIPHFTYTQKINIIEQNIEFVQFVFGILTILMVITVILVNAITTGQSVKDREKTNGILRAIGIRKLEIQKVFVIQILMFSIVVSLFSIILTLSGIHLIDSNTVGSYSKVFRMLYFKPIYGIAILVFALILNIISSFFALRKAVSDTPLKVIRAQ